MGCFCYNMKNEDKEEFLIKQNKELIEQNEIIVSTSIDLIESINKLGEKISIIQNNNNNNTETNIIKNSFPMVGGININDNINQNQLINNNYNENNNDNENKINIIFILEGKKQNVAINKNKQFLEAIKKLQEKAILRNDLNKIKLNYNSKDITKNVLEGEIISNLGINRDAEIKVSFRD